MFSCCRCNNVSKKYNKSDVSESGNGEGKDEIEQYVPNEKYGDRTGDIIEIPLKDPNEIAKSKDCDEDKTSCQSEEIAPVESIEAAKDATAQNIETENGSETTVKSYMKSDTTNSTTDESMIVNKSKEELCSNDTLSDFNSTIPNEPSNNHLTKSNRKDSDTTTITNGDLPKSCISRRSSSKSSIPKRVNINDSTEVIPSSEINSMDDDEVFSDSIPPKVSRGNMCAPYIKKRGSLPGWFPLPTWFTDVERFYNNECDGTLEPPVTPVGRDELELKRHRMYSELLRAAQAAVEHRVRFDPLGPDIATEENESNLKPPAADKLETLINRLEHLIERLEQSVNARELQLANGVLDSLNETRRRSFDIESADLPPLPDPPSIISKELETIEKNFNERIDRLENSLNYINNNFKQTSSEEDDSLENIPTVLEEYLQEDEDNKTYSMSVPGYEDIVNGPLAQYLSLSAKIGGDVAQHAALVKQAFDAQMKYVILATQISQPPQTRQMDLLKPTSNQINAIQTFREKNRTSPFFNHLSAISESIPALGWVCVSPTPGPHVKEMNDAGQFYTNRVLKDWKDKSPVHAEWARSWIQTLTQLQQYIKQYHTTGLVWSGKGAAPPPPPPSAAGCPPPPPPPVAAFDNLGVGDDRSALFAEINQGEGITKNLKRVTDDMQTHKNPTLRTGPAPFKAPQHGPGSSTQAPVQKVDKSPVFIQDGKKWLIEYQKANPNLLVENAEMNNVIYMFRCENSTLTVKGKLNNIVLDSCKKCSVLFESVVASVEFVNCQSVQMQVLGKVPTISIDKTDGCQMYLSKDALAVEIVSSKSSEMNVMIPKGDGDYTEQPIPEQYKTTIKGNSLLTICVESLG